MRIGVALTFSPIDPITALYWSAVLNGIVAAPVMVVTMRLAMRRDIMFAAKVPRQPGKKYRSRLFGAACPPYTTQIINEVLWHTHCEHGSDQDGERATRRAAASFGVEDSS